MMNTPLDADTRGEYLQWLSLASHEYFHAWSGKRLRPVELGPFDYENEVYTKSLWLVEGITDYYADLVLARAGVVTKTEFLGALSAQIRSLQMTPGRLEQPVEMASYDAWINYYRANENSAEHFDQLLREGSGAGIPAGREHQAAHGRGSFAR